MYHVLSTVLRMDGRKGRRIGVQGKIEGGRRERERERRAEWRNE
jgi:hypothetical protein